MLRAPAERTVNPAGAVAQQVVTPRPGASWRTVGPRFVARVNQVPPFLPVGRAAPPALVGRRPRARLRGLPRASRSPRCWPSWAGGSDVEVVVVDDASSEDPTRSWTGSGAIASRTSGSRTTSARRDVQQLRSAGARRAGAPAARRRRGAAGVLRGDGTGLDEDPPRSAPSAAPRTRPPRAPTHLSRSYRRRGPAVERRDRRDRARQTGTSRPAWPCGGRVYEAVGGFDTALSYGEDWEMWARLAAHGPVVFVDEVLARYRRHAASDTSARVQQRGQRARARHRDRGGARPPARTARRDGLRPPGAGVRGGVRQGRTALQLARTGPLARGGGVQSARGAGCPAGALPVAVARRPA